MNGNRFIAGRVGSKNKIKHVRIIAMPIGNSGRIRYQLGEAVFDGKGFGRNTGRVSGRGVMKPKLVMNIEVPKDNDLNRRNRREKLLVTKGKVLEESRITHRRRVRRAIKTAKNFSSLLEANLEPKKLMIRTGELKVNKSQDSDIRRRTSGLDPLWTVAQCYYGATTMPGDWRD